MGFEIIYLGAFCKNRSANSDADSSPALTPARTPAHCSNANLPDGKWEKWGMWEMWGKWENREKWENWEKWSQGHTRKLDAYEGARRLRMRACMGARTSSDACTPPGANLLATQGGYCRDTSTHGVRWGRAHETPGADEGARRACGQARAESERRGGAVVWAARGQGRQKRTRTSRASAVQARAPRHRCHVTHAPRAYEK